MKKQLYKIDKTDWVVSIRNGKCTRYAMGPTKKGLLDFVSKKLTKGAQVQVFKLSYEFKDSFIVK
jgi:hypothetical protein